MGLSQSIFEASHIKNIFQFLNKKQLVSFKRLKNNNLNNRLPPPIVCELENKQTFETIIKISKKLKNFMKLFI